ncbi:hypothetical protein RND81_11G021400 [Saponaria officinalis]|uniref:Peptidase M16 N-terminal domain-containing protein n=1 Tax=Saponaria officinalis TaxID=3572 RepID=A0AAW1HHD5_SAPOF
MGLITVSLVVRAGFLLEENREAGIAHLLEHVLLRSVIESTETRFGQLMFSHELHETSQRYTIFSFPVNGKSEFLEAIKLLNLIAKQKVLITEKQVKLEKKLVTIEYLTKLDSTAHISANSFLSQLFETSTLETCRKNLTKINSSELTKCYHTWYIPSQMAFIVTGNLNTKLLAEECCPVEAPSMDYIPRTVRWSFELKTLDDSNNENSLVFKLPRSSNLLQNVIMNILLSATTKRLKSGGGRASSIGTGLDVFVVFQHYDVRKVVYEVLRLKRWGLTTSEYEREINLVRREMKRNLKLFCSDEYHQINVLQNKLRDNFLFNLPITSLDSELQSLTTQTPSSLQDGSEEDGSEEDGSEDGSEVLSFVNKGLVVVPPEVWECESAEIKTLDLLGNSIKELPVTLSACSSLEALILSGNKINDWPADALKSLPTLTCLHLNNNPLNRIPSNGFEAVSRLTILDLSDCADSLLDNPSFASLQHLVELYLRRVNLQEVPSDIVLLKKLEILDLSHNVPHSIPQGFQNLTSMYQLDISENSIETLPPQLVSHLYQLFLLHILILSCY